MDVIIVTKMIYCIISNIYKKNPYGDYSLDDAADDVSCAGLCGAWSLSDRLSRRWACLGGGGMGRGL